MGHQYFYSRSNWKEKSKKINISGDELSITDLPGLYSLTVYSSEEKVALDSILERKYDLIINVCEAGNLPRNLYLTLQLLELNVPVMLVVNMMDELYNVECARHTCER